MANNWIEKYWKFMVLGNFEEAIPLKLANFPKSFFKYRGLSEQTIGNIEQNYIWLADIGTLNDPFECSIQVDNDECLREYYASDKFHNLFKILTGQSLVAKEVKKLTTSQKPFLEYSKICIDRKIPFMQSPEEQISKVQKRWSEIVEETNRNLRICSFSLIKNSLLLWSHYSDEHKGICIEYDFEDVDELRNFLQPIIYSEKVHKIGIFEDYNTMQMIGSSLVKSREWEYENEWRLTIFKQGDNFPQKMETPNPIGIYLGTRFHLNKQELKEKLFRIAKERNIPIYQMIKDPQEFKLIESKINTKNEKEYYNYTSTSQYH
ncbi:DUF2971 domain-containing protein [Flavobacterium sp.]|uniref:DUF2971 domain-containing protein n=1 Tax=Flavobacterium sp. TaxID=239 RepID=UPI0037514D93